MMMDNKEKIRILEEQIIDRFKKVYDPEIPVNIYDLGLIYEIKIDGNFDATVVMTLTAPNCPVAEILPGQVKATVESVEGIRKCDVELTFEPTWSQEMLSDEAKLDLGLL